MNSPPCGVDELEEIRRRKLEQLARRVAAQGEESEMTSNAQGKPVEVTDATFEDFVKTHPLTVVDCWAPWCGPCRMLAPVLDGLAQELAGRVSFGKLNTDENPGTAMRYQVASIPTLLIFARGKHVDTLIGARPRETILQRLEPLLK